MLSTHAQKMADISDYDVVQRVGDTVVGELGTTTVYLVMTHTRRIPTRNLSDVTVMNAAGPVEVGLPGSGAPIEMVRVSDFQTVLKGTEENLGPLRAKTLDRNLQLYYTQQGELVLQWTFVADPATETYDITKTDEFGVTTTIATGLSLADMGPQGAYVPSTDIPDGPARKLGDYFVYYPQGGLLGNGTEATYNIVVKEAGVPVVDYASEPLRRYVEETFSTGQPKLPPSEGALSGASGTDYTLTTWNNGVPTTQNSGEVGLDFGPGPMPKYATYKMDKQYVIRYYSLDSMANPELAAKAWVMQGSNDNGVTWYDLDTVALNPDPLQVQLRKIQNPNAYSWYRLKFTETFNGDPDNLLRINEVVLYRSLPGHGIGSMVIGDSFIVS